VGTEGTIQVSINALKVGLADGDADFKEALRSFDIASADGQPVVWAARMLGAPLPGRVNGTDLMYELLDVAEREGFSVYVLGARQPALEAAIGALQRQFPRLELAGWRDGYFDPAETGAVVDEIAGSGADILFVALPSPRKEWFLFEHGRDLNMGFAMGVGGSIDILAGAQRRAPRWMQRSGLEWLYRLLRDPVGMWRRYLTTNARFVSLLAKAILTRAAREPT
jgi:N-acetylglucosaminyldiphosphoundecaprenol N-acetyl-beta-D-mannosaminyltransferase